MKVKTIEEIEQLKIDWLQDPCWDIEETEGFELHKEELTKYRKEHEEIWRKRREEEECLIDAEADKIGVHGLYRMIKKHEEILNRHEKAISELSEPNYDGHKVYRILKGWD